MPVNLEAASAAPVSSGTGIAGADVNKNGIRDDLEQMLKTHYPGKAKRHAASLVLKGIRKGLVSDGSKEAAFKAVVSVDRALDCMDEVAGPARGAIENSFLRDRMLDTPQRIEAWDQLTNEAAGQRAPTEFDHPCRQ